MKVLVLTLNAWNNSNSTGNTLSNLFSAISIEDEIANIYCRNEVINNIICKRYFKITERDILHNIFRSRNCGQEIINFCDLQQSIGFNLLARSKKYDFLRKYRFPSLLFLRELIWIISVWKNEKLDKFLTDFAPDVIYMHGYSNLYMHKILDYCANKTGAKIVLFWGDDMYSRKCKLPLGYLYETLLRKRYRKSIDKASLVFGGSIKLCEEYTEKFSKQFIPFFKECKQVRYDESKRVGTHIRIVYAGNLLFGREQIIVDLVKIIAKVNNQKLPHNMQLIIFSNTNPTQKSMSILNDEENCCFMGCKPYAEVCEEMDKSDMVLFIESFKKQNIKLTRLSFSTKIIDCMQSTAGLLAIGPKEIASIDYLMRNNLGYIISNPSEIESSLVYLLKHPEFIHENNKHKVEYAKRFHTNTSINALNEIRNIL